MSNIGIGYPSESTHEWHTSHMATMAVALFFAMVGLDKLTGGYWVEVFDHIGFGQWFRYLTAAIQVIGAVLMVIKRTSLIGIGLLACTMVGAAIAQVRMLEGWGAAVVPGGLLIVLLIVGVIEFTDWRETRLSIHAEP